MPSRSLGETTWRTGRRPGKCRQKRLTDTYASAKRPPSQTQTAKPRDDSAVADDARGYTDSHSASLPGSAACWIRCGKPALPTLLGGSTRSLDHSGFGSATPEGASQPEPLTGSRTRGPAPGRSPPCPCPRDSSATADSSRGLKSAAPSRLGRGGSPGQRSRCPGFVLARQIQLSRSKFQTNLKTPTVKFQTDGLANLSFGSWDLFGIWHLRFET
jgi:hypothetical protein